VRNPALAAFDRPNASSKPVGALFVDKQLELMRAEKLSEDEAYARARAWMLENGKRFFAQLDVPKDVKAALVRNQSSQGARGSSSPRSCSRSSSRPSLSASARPNSRGAGGEVAHCPAPPPL
jgi:hypothetical protein